MTQSVIVMGQTFTVTCETGLASLGSYTCTIKYRRPDGVTGSLTPTVTGTTLIGTITPTENPVTGRAGKWSFYPNIISGAIVYKGATDHVIVSKEYQE
jgi:hypothetical protein